MKTTYPKDSMYQCPECLRHFMGGVAMRRYDGRCNLCDAQIDLKKDRVR